MAMHSTKKSPMDPRDGGSRSPSPERRGGIRDQLRGLELNDQLALLSTQSDRDRGEGSTPSPSNEPNTSGAQSATSIDDCVGVAKGLAQAQVGAERYTKMAFDKCHYTASTLIALMSENPAAPQVVDVGLSTKGYGGVDNGDGLPALLRQNAQDGQAHAYRVRFNCDPDSGPLGMHSWVVLQQGERIQHLQSDMGNYQLGKWMQQAELSSQVSEVAHAQLGPEVSLGTYVGMLETAVARGVFAPLTGIAALGTESQPLTSWELHWDEWRLPETMPAVDPERVATAVGMGTDDFGPVGYMTTYKRQ